VAYIIQTQVTVCFPFRVIFVWTTLLDSENKKNGKHFWLEAYSYER